MPTNIDDKELSRMEYLIESSESCGYSTQSNDPNMQYLAAACHYTPALVAEVRRLREKVEAWEWYGECFDNCKQRGKLPFEMHKTPSAYSEAWATLWAAREAVHADSE